MIETQELCGYRALHTAFRVELERIARAAAAPRDAAHEAMLDEQLSLVLDVLADHLAELRLVRPDRTPTTHPSLVDLAAAVRDTSRPLAERAQLLHRLADTVRAHLDEADRVVVPLLLRHATPDDLERARARAFDRVGRERLVAVFGWVASCLDDDHLEAALAEHPPLVRYLFRRFWWPEHEQRMAALYGPSVRPVSATLTRTAA